MFMSWFFIIIGVITIVCAAIPSFVDWFCYLAAIFKNIGVNYSTSVEIVQGKINLKKEISLSKRKEKEKQKIEKQTEIEAVVVTEA